MPALKRLSLAALMLALLAAGPALAESATPEPVHEKTAVVVDEEAGTVLIFIKGRAMAVIDETGLHVREDISYGGMFPRFPSF